VHGVWPRDLPEVIFYEPNAALLETAGARADGGTAIFVPASYRRRPPSRVPAQMGDDDTSPCKSTVAEIDPTSDQRWRS